jgi:hypothetical protein
MPAWKTTKWSNVSSSEFMVHLVVLFHNLLVIGDFESIGFIDSRRAVAWI